MNSSQSDESQQASLRDIVSIRWTNHSSSQILVGLQFEFLVRPESCRGFHTRFTRLVAVIYVQLKLHAGEYSALISY
jgi:hypothetical protein